MTYQEYMIYSLSDLLEKNETLKYPIYGILKQKRRNLRGFWGLTDNFLLNSLLDGTSNRIPLDIKSVKVKKCLFPLQFKIRIDFVDGSSCELRVSKKVHGMTHQETNLSEFIKHIQNVQKE